MNKKPLVILGLLLSSCGTKTTDENKSTNVKDAKIAFIGSSLDSYNVKMMFNAIDSLGLKSKYGHNINFYDSDEESIKEMQNTKDAIKNNAEVLIFEIANGLNIDALKYAKKQDKKIIVVGNKVYGLDVDGFVLPDYLEAGSKLATQVKNELGKNKDINFLKDNSIYMIGSEENPDSKKKYDAFIKQWKEFSDVDVISSSYNKVLATSKSKQIIEANQYTNLWISDTPNTTLGIVSTNKEKFGNENLHAKQKKLIAGFGYNGDIDEELKKGNIYSVVAFKWAEAMEISIKWADSLIKNNFEIHKDIKEAYLKNDRIIKFGSTLKGKSIK